MNVRTLFACLLCVITTPIVLATDAPETFQNPILPGFHPDPSICRVGDDYYLATSSFTWYPGLPIYHSKDLVNWKRIGHALDRPDMVNMKDLDDNNGIWAPTIRYHNGLFYLITTANKSGGNFYITATNPAGPWSDPVWLEDAPGIDPSLFWDEDGRCYCTGNTWDFPKSWPAQCAVWMQEIDLAQGKLIGERNILTYGHANNATYAEGPHLYKVNGQYVLLMAEGGSSYHHAVTVHQSKSLWGPYVANKVNPVITHRHLGRDYPIQNLGHADLVQTQQGKWYAVLLGIRPLNGHNPLARETFLCKAAFEDGSLLFNPGKGIVLEEQERPNLPWTPFEAESTRETFDDGKLTWDWYFVRVPQTPFHTIDKGRLTLQLQPEVIDSLVSSSMMIRKTTHHRFTAITHLDFTTKKANEQAGLVYYRTANGYYSLMKGKEGLVFTKKHLGKKTLIAQAPYTEKSVYLMVDVNGLEATFRYGANPNTLTDIGGVQSTATISDNKFNKFNGPGVGVYATSNGQKTTNKASFDWFDYVTAAH
ncbi:MAG: glycoside hydrolase family 43 protein [Bacteroidales bacterium]|nr:glycoside hydrolase family 43 protein [Bacteroidales bacterium]